MSESSFQSWKRQRPFKDNPHDDNDDDYDKKDGVTYQLCGNSGSSTVLRVEKSQEMNAIVSGLVYQIDQRERNI